MKKILFIVNTDWFFTSHRLPIAIEAISKGYEVHIATTVTNKLELLEKCGLIVHNLDMRRGRVGLTIFIELWNFFSIIKSVDPDIVHLVTIKPVLLGGIVARLLGVPALVSAVSGLGIVFSSARLKYRFFKWVLRPLYYLTFNHKNQRIIFQNGDDLRFFSGSGATFTKKSTIIHGSGVDLSSYAYLPEPTGTPVVTLAARLLIDKGVEVFVKASEILKERKINVRFWLIGEPDPENDNSVTIQQLENWQSLGLIELFGYREDMPSLFSQSNIVILPSFYGEGLPKVLIEAAACGRAVITTDHPGCRDAIDPGKTGILVPTRDPESLADAICSLLENPTYRNNMGVLGRRRAENMFDVRQVVAEHMCIYEELLEKGG
jgi:glycosyltransferase involved in cell wall biosynthesis